MASFADLKDKRLTVVLIDDLQLNAFAAPGGIIGVNAGIFLHTKNEQELAAVLAHELAHLSQRHFARNVQDSKDQRLPQAAALLGSILLAATGGEAGLAALTSVIAGSVSHQLRYSRQQEMEADRIGLQILHQAKINPNAMPEMLKRLQQLGAANESLSFLQTHPVTTERIADTEGRVARRSKIESYRRPNSLAFELVRMRVRIHFAANQLNAFLNTVQNQLKNPLPFPQALHYGLAILYTDLKQFPLAQKQIAFLLKNNNNNFYYQWLKIYFLFHKEQQNEALKLSKKLVRNNTNNYPSTMQYATLLYKTEHYNECRVLLKQFINTQPNNPFVWKLFANATGKTKRIGEYYMANATYLHLTGKTEKAINQLRYALNNLRLRYEQRQAMQEQTRQLKKDEKMIKLMSLTDPP